MNIGLASEKRPTTFVLTDNIKEWELFNFENSGKPGRFYIVGFNNLILGGNDKKDS